MGDSAEWINQEVVKNILSPFEVLGLVSILVLGPEGTLKRTAVIATFSQGRNEIESPRMAQIHKDKSSCKSSFFIRNSSSKTGTSPYPWA